jgi:hypothetical protein
LDFIVIELLQPTPLLDTPEWKKNYT